MNVYAVIFDWDGVIADTMPSIAFAISEVAKSYQVDVSAESVLATYFQPRLSFYKSIGIDPEDKEELNRRHIEAVARNYAGEIYPDTRPALTELKRRGIRLAVATQNEVPDIMREIVRFSLEDFFASEYVVGGPGTKEEKLRKLAGKLDIAPGNILFVGDLPSDITAGKDAGMMSAGINRLEAGRQRLVREKPDALLESLAELPDILSFGA